MTVIKKVAILIAALLLFPGPSALAFNVKGYQWGRPFGEMRQELENRNKKPVVDEQKPAIVFTDTVFGKECKVSLLFTPKTKLLAGIAMVWKDPAVASEAFDNITKKYGPPAPSSGAAKTRRYFIWYSPTSRYDRIALVAYFNRTVLGYYGGEYYKKYEEESAPVAGKQTPASVPAGAQSGTR
jgi:hypothetical protein